MDQFHSGAVDHFQSGGIMPCSGSLYPAHHLQLGDEVVCEFCRARLHVVAPPDNRNRDPWPGSPSPRVEAHLSVWRAPGD